MGGLLQLICVKLVGIIITVCTLGICAPWAICMVYRWEAKHTIIDGYRMHFDGTAMQLFANWIKWLLLCLITFGIYAFWVSMFIRRKFLLLLKKEKCLLQTSAGGLERRRKWYFIYYFY